MRVVVLLSLVLWSSAVPVIREQDPIVIDGEEGLLFEIPEYENPELIEYELSALGGSPVLSLLQLPKNRPRPTSTPISDTKEPGTKMSVETILDLSELLQELKALQHNTQNGGDSNHLNDFTKAMHGLKMLESSIGPDVRQLLNTMHQSMSLLNPIIKIGIMPLVSGKPYKDDELLQRLAMGNGALFNVPMPIKIGSKFSDDKVKSTESPIELIEHDEQDHEEDDGVSIYESKWRLKSLS